MTRLTYCLIAALLPAVAGAQGLLLNEGESAVSVSAGRFHTKTFDGWSAEFEYSHRGIVDFGLTVDHSVFPQERSWPSAIHWPVIGGPVEYASSGGPVYSPSTSPTGTYGDIPATVVSPTMAINVRSDDRMLDAMFFARYEHSFYGAAELERDTVVPDDLLYTGPAVEHAKWEYDGYGYAYGMGVSHTFDAPAGARVVPHAGVMYRWGELETTATSWCDDNAVEGGSEIVNDGFVAYTVGVHLGLRSRIGIVSVAPAAEFSRGRRAIRMSLGYALVSR